MWKPQIPHKLTFARAYLHEIYSYLLSFNLTVIKAMYDISYLYSLNAIEEYCSHLIYVMPVIIPFIIQNGWTEMMLQNVSCFLYDREDRFSKLLTYLIITEIIQYYLLNYIICIML